MKAGRIISSALTLVLTSCLALLFSVTQTQAQTANAPQAGNCDPSYPDVCIQPYPPDLNCGDVPYKDITVLPPDPHGFDREGDGIGCES